MSNVNATIAAIRATIAVAPKNNDRFQVEHFMRANGSVDCAIKIVVDGNAYFAPKIGSLAACELVEHLEEFVQVLFAAVDQCSVISSDPVLLKPLAEKALAAKNNKAAKKSGKAAPVPIAAPSNALADLQSRKAALIAAQG